MKKQNGITLIALLITIIVLLILAGVSIATLTGDNGLLTRANNSKEVSEKAEVEERVKLILTEWELAKKEPNNTLTLEEFLNSKITSKELDKVTKNEDGSFTLELKGYKIRINGDGTLGEISKGEETTPPTTGSWNGKVNTPMISKGMIPIKHNGTNWVVCNESDPEWFNYIDQSAGIDLTSKWANIMLSDGTYKEGTVKVGQIVQENELGSMYVWIPRYAYAITSGYHNNPINGGIIKVAFLEGTKEYKVGDSVNYTYQGNKETGTIKNVSGQGNMNEHPAFNYGGKVISGIWISKFEASSETPTVANGGGNVTNLKIKSLPNVPSWRSITVSNIYTNCINMNNSANATFYGIEEDDTKIDPHMMKNSEWGAIAYLTQSSYGRNGNEIYKNNNSNYITGISGGSTNASSSTSITNSYTTAIGQKASTTGNISGVYDINGGAFEYVAGYVNNGNSSLQTYASSLVNSTTVAHKDVYEKGTADDRPTNYNQMSGRYGDAVYETSNSASSGTGSWFSDYALCPYSSFPFFLRGGSCNDASGAGAFFFRYDSGSAHSHYSFRSVLVALPLHF